MGYGDELMATGLARGARARGKRIAFGDGHSIRWHPRSKQIFLGNPNIAPPGSESADDIEWIAFYKGHRLYNRQVGDRWRWNMEFKAKPGEVFFSRQEKLFAQRIAPGFIAIEPNTPPEKSCAVNKQWPVDRFQVVADELLALGHRVVQFVYGNGIRLRNVAPIRTNTFRAALAALQRARLAILPEGGLHHGAAAVDLPAVVLFGGFIPPQVTGYDTHLNLTGNAGEACGSLHRCQHCIDALNRISVDEVLDASHRLMQQAA